MAPTWHYQKYSTGRFFRRASRSLPQDPRLVRGMPAWSYYLTVIGKSPDLYSAARKRKDPGGLPCAEADIPLCSRASTERSGALGAKVRDGKSKRRTPLRHSREASKLKTRMAFWSLCGLRGAGSATTEHGGCDDQWSDVSGGAVWPSIDLMRCKGSTASFPSLQHTNQLGR